MKEDKIIQQALKMFMQYGIRSVSMDDVSRELGISKKTLYTVVDSKSELVRLVVETHQADEEAIMDKIVDEAEDAVDAMINVGRYIIDMVKNMKPSVIYDLQKYYRKIYDHWNAIHSQCMQDMVTNNLNLGIKQGFYRPELEVDVIAKLYVGKVHIIMDEKIFPPENYSQADVVRQHFIYHLHGILTHKGLSKMYDENLLKVN